MPLGLGWAIGSVAVGLWGKNKEAKAAGKQARKQNEAVERQHEYNLKAYDMKGDQLRAEYAYRVQETALKRQNEGNAADYRDAINSQNYARQLMIRNREQASLDAQFERSNELYAAKTGYNQRVAQKAFEDENRKLDEIHTEATFDAQEQRIKHLQEEGKIRALGQAGVSVGKTHQSIAANFGYQISALNQGLESAGMNHASALEDIKNDKFSADLAAYAEKMLDPGELPMPIEPILTPRTIYQDPEPLQDFHFGPPPVKGATVDVGAAKSAVWGSGIPSILNSGLNAYNMASQW
tara:strand:- start:2697 stop:3581 length:885 start_codon:yes stop_codon:yes gene_type:complete